MKRALLHVGSPAGSPREQQPAPPPDLPLRRRRLASAAAPPFARHGTELPEATVEAEAVRGRLEQRASAAQQRPPQPPDSPGPETNDASAAGGAVPVVCREVPNLLELSGMRRPRRKDILREVKGSGAGHGDELPAACGA
mmetsp:Transcript_184599/g.585472  ORF Transcript_184599/g.585472 Transcript_184599/m.585472 type:complete len:140 (-) Transcript_184599:810-1229(-)